MLIFSHIATGYLITHALAHAGKLSHINIHTAYLISAISSTIPDLDVIINKGKIVNHRQNSIFHYPLFWMIILSLESIYLILINQSALLVYIPLIGINLIFHFLLDSFGVDCGVKWLAPFKRCEYSFFRLKISNNSSFNILAANYLISPIMILESIIWIYTYVIIKKTGLFF